MILLIFVYDSLGADKDCLLGDIRTFLDGIEQYLQNKEKFTDRGGGNLSIPSLVCTGLEFVSALYVGDTQYLHDGDTRCVRQNYNATDNVKKFIGEFFPTNCRNIPLILWDGIRNGIIHIFSPKALRYSAIISDFNSMSKIRKFHHILKRSTMKF